MTLNIEQHNYFFNFWHGTFLNPLFEGKGQTKAYHFLRTIRTLNLLGPR